jgi:hypothetical protein
MARWSEGDVIGIAADLESKSLSFALNGLWETSFEVLLINSAVLATNDPKNKNVLTHLNAISSQDICVDGGLYPAMTANSGAFSVNLGTCSRLCLLLALLLPRCPLCSPPCSTLCSSPAFPSLSSLFSARLLPVCHSLLVSKHSFALPSLHFCVRHIVQ